VDKYHRKRFTLPKQRILKSSKEIREVLHEGKRLSGKSINIFYILADEEKFAVVVPKRIGNAVKRNRMKRLAREIYRKNPVWFQNMKVIFFIKRFNNNYSQLETEIGQLVKQI
jgi:ribonuclease P protein component